jgi:hypothetical protein
MQQRILVVASLGLVVACSSAQKRVQFSSYAAVDGRTTNPGRHFGPEQFGPPISLPDGSRISVVKRVCKENYFDDETDEFRSSGLEVYTVVREGEINTGPGFYRKLVVTPEGDVIVAKYKSKQSSEPSWFDLDLKTYREAKHVAPVDLVQTAGEPMQAGRGSPMFVMRYDFKTKPGESRRTAKTWDARGKLVGSWDKLVKSSKSGSWLPSVGKLKLLFTTGPSGERLAQILDDQHRPMGDPFANFEEISMAMPRDSNGSRATRLFLARPSPKDPSMYTLLLENGTFDAPPGLIGVRRMPRVSERAAEVHRNRDDSSGLWLVAFEGERWGWAASDFSQESGPIWSNVKLVEGPALSALYVNFTNGAPLVYLVSEDATTRKWTAFTPEFPLESFAKEDAANEGEAVALSERACQALVDESKMNEATKLAASEAAKKAAADRRIAGGASKDKDERWETAMKYWRSNLGSPDDTAMQLGGVYLVDYVLQFKTTRPELLQRAVSEAKKFDPIAEKKIAATLKDVQAAAASRKKEREAQEAAERLQASAPVDNSSRSTQLQWEPGQGKPTKYDARTGARSDTQAIQDWTYGRSKYKPAF